MKFCLFLTVLLAFFALSSALRPHPKQMLSNATPPRMKTVVCPRATYNIEEYCNDNFLNVNACEDWCWELAKVGWNPKV